MLAEAKGIEAFGSTGAFGPEIEYNGLFTWDMYLVAVSIMACAAVVPGYGFLGGESAGSVSGEDMADVSAGTSPTASGDIGRYGTQHGPRSEGRALRGHPDTNQNPTDVLEPFLPSSAFADDSGLFPTGSVPTRTAGISMEEMR